MNPKEKLYTLLDDFVQNRMCIESFCRLFSSTYEFDIDEDCLTNDEQNLFAILAHMTYGYTPLEKDRLVCPQYYFNDQQIIAKVDEVIQYLKTKSEHKT